MSNGAQLIEALVQGCSSDDLCLAPDLGWVAIGGMDPVEFIDRYGARIVYVHTRGVTEMGPNGRTVETGQGILDYSAIVDALERTDFDGWLIAESEYRPPWAGNNDPDESARLHLRGLRTALMK